MKNILKEEINQIKYLFGYKRGVVISEQVDTEKQKEYLIKKQMVMDINNENKYDNVISYFDSLINNQPFTGTTNQDMLNYIDTKYQELVSNEDLKSGLISNMEPTIKSKYIELMAMKSSNTLQGQTDGQETAQTTETPITGQDGGSLGKAPTDIVQILKDKLDMSPESVKSWCNNKKTEFGENGICIVSRSTDKTTAKTRRGSYETQVSNKFSNKEQNAEAIEDGVDFYWLTYAYNPKV